MRYWQWGNPDHPRALICVHGLTRVGRDFDHLARVMSQSCRIICPDVVGRGGSDWLRDPMQYSLPQYVADMVSLIARVDAREIDWLGTSMGGLIGIGLAGMENSPIRRLVLNDVGPRLEMSGLARIAAYVGQPIRFQNLDEAIAYNRSIAAGFGMRSDGEWKEITASVLKRDGDGYVLHYDPAIGLPMRAFTPELIAAGEQLLWQRYDAIRCPTLVLRGENSDVLSPDAAIEMTRRGPRARLAVVPGIGHAPMFFDPAQIELVRAFLESGQPPVS
jgi:pimeloyl-ACP methyl ester carboxylesterase